MCQSGVNTAQLLTMSKMAEEALDLSLGWLEEIHHLADHVDETAGAEYAQATVKLGEARHILEAARDKLEAVAEEPAFEVELV
jgi:hypothetical protein